MSTVRLSLSGFLFEDGYASQSIPFARFCSLAAEAGYRGVELRRTQVNPDTSRPRRAELLNIVLNAGLGITCLTARGLPGSGPERKGFFLRYLDLCNDLNCPLLKIGGDTAWLHGAAATAQARGVCLATNNHVGGPLETVAGTRQYFANIAHPNVGLLYDSLHLRVSGEDCLRCIAELTPITKNVLVHSVRPAAPDRPAGNGIVQLGGRPWRPALPDEPGVQDWPAILSSFRSLDYGGLITVIESGWPAPQRERVAKHCAGVIRRLWEQA